MCSFYFLEIDCELFSFISSMTNGILNTGVSYPVEKFLKIVCFMEINMYILSFIVAGLLSLLLFQFNQFERI